MSQGIIEFNAVPINTPTNLLNYTGTNSQPNVGLSIVNYPSFQQSYYLQLQINGSQLSNVTFQGIYKDTSGNSHSVTVNGYLNSAGTLYAASAVFTFPNIDISTKVTIVINYTLSPIPTTIDNS